MLDEDAEEDTTLYHYTTIDGLYGILESGMIWATNPVYLNDSREIEYGVSKLAQDAETYQEELEANTDDPRKQSLSRSLIGLARVMREDQAKAFKYAGNQFIACFSQSRDQLSQWRGYSRGGGYSIAFDRDLLKESLKGANGKGSEVFLMNVTYDWRECVAQFRTHLDKFMERVEPSIPPDGGIPPKDDDATLDLWADAVSRIYPLIAALGITMKHYKFREEREVRALGVAGDVFYTPSQLGLIPRVKFQFDSKAITEITVGPGQHAEAKAASIRHYLLDKQDRYSDIKINLSNVPYRDV
ncbi:DUF2971 domain-containing protein [Mycobacterium sp. NPDC003449]